MDFSDEFKFSKLQKLLFRQSEAFYLDVCVWFFYSIQYHYL